MRIVKNVCWLILISFFIACVGEEKVYYVEVETEYGNMKVELYNSSPLHRDNFIKLVKEGFYNDLLFHRVIQGFMIQGGDPESRNAPQEKNLGSGGPGYTIPNEISAPHFKGTLAAARTPDQVNPEKRSSGSQFYIVQGQIQNPQSLQSYENLKKIKYNEAQRSKYLTIGGAPSLDQEYTVFGEIVSGMDVIDKIASVQTNQFDRPVRDITMKIKIVK